MTLTAFGYTATIDAAVLRAITTPDFYVGA
jgi:hypothetical protein